MGPLSSGGAEKQALLLAKTLNNDLDITVISYYGDVRLQRMVDFAEEAKIKVEYLFGSPLKKIWSFHKVLGRLKPEAMFMYLPSNNLIGGVLGRIHGVKMLFGGVRTSRLPKFHYRILYVAHNYLNHVTIFNNYEGYRHLTAQGFNPNKGVVIHNCFNPFAEPIDKKEVKPVTILTCARFEHFKDYESAIAAISMLKAKTSLDFKYRIVGTGSMKDQVLSWIDQYQVGDVVDIIENPEDIDQHYRQADIYFCSSTYEGLSNSVLEAMNRCLPIVSTRAGDHDRLAVDNETGFLVEVGDRQAMADRLLALVEDFELRTRLGANAYQNLISNYSLEKFRTAYLNLIDRTRK